MKILSALLTLALVGVCSTAMAQWQWLDKDGRKVFSDRSPPPDVLEKDIIKRPGGVLKPSVAKDTGSNDSVTAGTADAPATRSTPLTTGVDKDLEAKKKQAADAEAAKRKAEEDRVTKARVENCARAKQSLSTFDSGLRISRTNASGEREVMDDTSRAVERARVQGLVESECK